MSVFEKARRIRALVLAMILLGAAGPAMSNEEKSEFVVPDMTLYFNGGNVEQIRSAQAVMLVYLPAIGPGEDDYDPAHEDIATVAMRLSDNVAVVPLTQIWPVQDPYSRRWIERMRCALSSGVPLTEDAPLLYFSFSDPNGRACVIAIASGEEMAQLAVRLLDLEVRNCSGRQEFQDDIYRWAYHLRRAQKGGQGLASMAAVRAALVNAETPHC